MTGGEENRCGTCRHWSAERPVTPEDAARQSLEAECNGVDSPFWSRATRATTDCEAYAMRGAATNDDMRRERGRVLRLLARGPATANDVATLLDTSSAIAEDMLWAMEQQGWCARRTQDGITVWATAAGG